MVKYVKKSLAIITLLFFSSYGRAVEISQSLISIRQLATILKDSQHYEDLVKRLITEWQPEMWGAFFAIKGDPTVKTYTPQFFYSHRNMTAAIAPHTYAELVISYGEEVSRLQLVEEAYNKDNQLIDPKRKAEDIFDWKSSLNFSHAKIIINGHYFADGAIHRVSNYEITPAEMIEKYAECDQNSTLLNAKRAVNFIKKADAFAEVACTNCHFHPRRYLVEAHSHDRTFLLHKNWVFRDSDKMNEIKRKLEAIFDSFATHPRVQEHAQWKFMFDQSDGPLRPEDTFTYDRFRQMLPAKGVQEFLGYLKRNHNLSQYKDLFYLALTNPNGFENAIVQRNILTRSDLNKIRNEILVKHGKNIIKVNRIRNKSSISWILAGVDGYDRQPSYAENNYLLLTKEVARDVGPVLSKLLDEGFVSVNEFDGFDLTELRRISNENPHYSTIRANTHIAINIILGQAPKSNEAFHYLSFGLSKSAESYSEHFDIIGLYEQLLKTPVFSPFRQEIIQHK